MRMRPFCVVPWGDSDDEDSDSDEEDSDSEDSDENESDNWDETHESGSDEGMTVLVVEAESLAS